VGFNIYLEQPSRSLLLKEIDQPPEDYFSLIIEACSLLEETDCRFLVSGFGDDAWPVDVGYDLSTVVEQLPDLLASLRGGGGGTLDFYEQGIERQLEFFPEAGKIQIRCCSRTAWKPNPATEYADLDQLEAMFVKLTLDFAVALEKVNPDLARTPPISAWRHGQA
jgi:hypothetical protein